MDDFFAWITKYKDALGLIGTASAAIAAGAWAIYRFRREKRAVELEPRGGGAPDTLPEMRSRAQPSEPNLVVLECKVIKVAFTEELEAVESHESPKKAAVIVMRNDPVKGRRVARMPDTRALMRFTIDGGRTVHVAAGQWLDAGLNCVDFEPGSTNVLIVAVRVPGVTRLAVPDDRRELNGPDDVRGVELPEMLRADLALKLVGGFDSEYVEEFNFVLTMHPLAIRQV